MEIVTRAQWGARYPAGFGAAPDPADEVWLHHSATSTGRPGSSLELDVLSVRLLENIGQARFGGGISYTYAITPSGRVFEGTGPGRVGAHTKGRNTHARGIVLVGNYDTAEPTPAMLDAAAQLLAHGARVGWWRHPAFTGGHRDAPGAATACPGRLAYAHLGTMNAAAALTLDAARHGEDGPELDVTERQMLAEVHARTCTEHHDYRAHHGAPDDITAGQALSIRKELHELAGALSAQLASVQQQLGQLLSTSGRPPGGTGG